MLGDDTRNEQTQPLAMEFAGIVGADFTPTAIDWDTVSVDYVKAAQAKDAANRFAWFAKNHPELCETDWTRPQFATNAAALSQIRGWKYGKKGLIATGPSGRGKTRAICDLYRRLACEEAIDVRYYFAGDWFSSLQQQLQYGRDEARGWVEACASRRLVIIEDLGQEAVQTSRQDWAQAWLFRFLDLRIAKGLPLIISTNLTAKTMSETTSNLRTDPLIRRISDLCEAVRFV